jgi:hypothetical protein
MAGGKLRQVDGAAAGAWIEPRLDGWGGKVKEQIPQIYDAYVRIFHPASDGKGNPATWDEVATALGSTAHREMQWHAIVGSYDYSNFKGSKWSGGSPNISELDEEPLVALCAILGRHTSSPERCYFGISTIHGGVEEEFPDEPLFRLPHRDFAILAGPLSAVDQIAISNTHSTVISFSTAVPTEDGPPPDPDPSTSVWGVSPNLIWPENRAWFVVTEYDFDSTLVGGSRELIDAILDSPDLEAWEVDPEVSLQADADKINPVPDPPPGFDEPGDPDELQRSFFTETLEMLRGQVLDAGVTDSGVLEVEIGGPGDSRWRLIAENSDWSSVDLMGLKSLAVEAIELDPETDALRCRLSDGSLLDIRPLERKADDDPPSWRIEIPSGLVLKHGPDLLVDFDGLAGPTFEG